MRQRQHITNKQGLGNATHASVNSDAMGTTYGLSCRYGLKLATEGAKDPPALGLGRTVLGSIRMLWLSPDSANTHVITTVFSTITTDLNPS
jgi:hypothetical protein